MITNRVIDVTMVGHSTAIVGHYAERYGKGKGVIIAVDSAYKP